jgi:hypothetical protein
MLFTLVAGCAGDDTDAAHLDSGTRQDSRARDAGEPGCGDGARICDIREAACQESIADVVACLRESHSLRPPVRLVSEDEYTEMITPTDAPASALLANQRWRNGLALLGLVAPDSDVMDAAEEHAELTAAAYMQTTREVLVIDRGMPLDDARAVETLAHEMVHAMQDDEFDLQAWSKRWVTGEDSALAVAAVVEGEATHYQLLFDRALAGVPVEGVDWDKLYGDWQDETYEMADADEAPFDRARLRFPYAFGAALVARAWLERGRAGIDALMVRPPRTTYEVLFGKPEGADEATRQLQAVALPVPPSGYQPVTFSALGAWHTRAFLRRAGLDADAALAATKTIAADVMSVMVDPDDETPVAVWRMRQLAQADQDWAELVPDAISWTEASDIFIVVGPEAVREQARDFVWLPIPTAMGRIPPRVLPDVY